MKTLRSWFAVIHRPRPSLGERSRRSPPTLYILFLRKILSPEYFVPMRLAPRWGRGSSRQTQDPLPECVFYRCKRQGRSRGDGHAETNAGRAEERTHRLRMVFETYRHHARRKRRIARDLSRLQDKGTCTIGGARNALVEAGELVTAGLSSQGLECLTDRDVCKN